MSASSSGGASSSVSALTPRLASLAGDFSIDAAALLSSGFRSVLDVDPDIGAGVFAARLGISESAPLYDAVTDMLEDIVLQGADEITIDFTGKSRSHAVQLPLATHHTSAPSSGKRIAVHPIDGLVSKRQYSRGNTARQDICCLPTATGRARTLTPPIHLDAEQRAHAVRNAEAMWSMLMEFGDSSHLVKSFRTATGDHADQFRLAYLQSWEQLPLSSSGAHLSFLNKWKEFCIESGTDYRSPDSLQLAMLLTKVRPNGATAARGVRDQARWWELEAGIPFETSLPMLARLAKTKPHPLRKADAITMFQWHALGVRMESPSVYVASLALFWMATVQAAVRAAHAGRARLSAVFEQHVEFQVSRGKVDGISYTTTAPRFTPFGQDHGGLLRDLLCKIHGASDLDELPWYILPDFLPRRKPLHKIMEFDGVAMKETRALKLLQATALDGEFEGMDRHSGRHTLATVADISRFHPGEALLVGWSGSCSMSRVTQSDVRMNLMPRRYSSATLGVEARAKIELVRTVAHVATTTGDLDLKWEQYIAMWPTRELIWNSMASIADAPATAKPAATRESDSSSQTSATSEVSSTSDSAAVALDDDAGWIRAVGAGRRTHLQDAQGEAACGEAMKEYETGASLSSSPAPWCKRCLLRLTDAQFARLS